MHPKHLEARMRKSVKDVYVSDKHLNLLIRCAYDARDSINEKYGELVGWLVKEKERRLTEKKERDEKRR